MQLKSTETTYHFDNHATGSAASVEIVVSGNEVVQVLCSPGLSIEDLWGAVRVLTTALRAPDGKSP